MRHHSKKRKFSLQPNTGATMMTSLCLELIEHGTITTTIARAKEVRPQFERLVTKSKIDSLSNRRYALSRLFNNVDLVKKLFEEVAPSVADRLGGYTRITKLPARKSDGAPLAVISLVS